MIFDLKKEFDAGFNSVEISDSLRDEIYRLYQSDANRHGFNKFVVVTCLLGLSLHQRGDFFSVV